jgi:hypothetical protein
MKTSQATKQISMASAIARSRGFWSRASGDFIRAASSAGSFRNSQTPVASLHP